MQIKVYATLRELLGLTSLSMSVATMSTVGDVLRALGRSYPKLEAKLWDAEQNRTGYVTVLLNGRSIDYLQGLATPVGDTDVIALFPPVGGG